MATAKKVLRADLIDPSASMFYDIKRFLNLKTDAEVVRYLIGQEHRRISNRTGQIISDTNLSEKDRALLVIIAEDHWRQFGSFEEKEVRRSILEQHSDAKKRSEEWMTEAIQYVFSQKRN